MALKDARYSHVQGEVSDGKEEHVAASWRKGNPCSMPPGLGRINAMVPGESGVQQT